MFSSQLSTSPPLGSSQGPRKLGTGPEGGRLAGAMPHEDCGVDGPCIPVHTMGEACASMTMCRVTPNPQRHGRRIGHKRPKPVARLGAIAQPHWRRLGRQIPKSQAHAKPRCRCPRRRPSRVHADGGRGFATAERAAKGHTGRRGGRSAERRTGRRRRGGGAVGRHVGRHGMAWRWRRVGRHGGGGALGAQA